MDELFSECRNVHVEPMAMLLFQISNSAVTTSLLRHPLVIPVLIHGPLTSTTHIQQKFANICYIEVF